MPRLIQRSVALVLIARLAALAGSVSLYGCSAAGGGSPDCSTRTCACTTGDLGVQSCDTATNTYGPCDCTSTTPAYMSSTNPQGVDPAPTGSMTDPVPVPPPPPPPVSEPPPAGSSDPSFDVPTTEHCARAANWDPLWRQWEEEVLLLVNQSRAYGGDCRTEGTFPPSGPLVMTPELRCAARLHSLDMAERAYFEHVNPDGADPSLRMLAAGYVGSAMGENIAFGQSSPQLVHGGWMLSDGHCANVLMGFFTEIGIGYHGGGVAGQHYWTENFGRR